MSDRTEEAIVEPNQAAAMVGPRGTEEAVPKVAAKGEFLVMPTGLSCHTEAVRPKKKKKRSQLLGMPHQVFM